MTLERNEIDVKYGKVSYFSSNSESSRCFLYLDGAYGRPDLFFEADLEKFSSPFLSTFNWIAPLFTGSVTGYHSTNSDAHTIMQYAHDVYQILVNEKVKSVAVFGYSMGASVAIHLIKHIQKDKNMEIEAI